MRTILKTEGMHRIRIGLLLCGLCLLPIAGAQAEYWGTSLATATPQFLPGGGVTAVTVVGSPDGKGVRSEAPSECDDFATCRSITRLFVPVTPPRGTRFDSMWLRAFDSNSSGYVRATFYRQDLLGGSPEALGQIATHDGGHQVLATGVKAYDRFGTPGPVVIGPVGPSEPTYTYYVEVDLITTGILYDPDALLIGYDVGFDLDSCSSSELPGFDGLSCF